MGGVFELTFCDLRCKEIVNSVDGKKLGRILDLVFTMGGEVRGIIAPYGRRGVFFKCQEIFIPWRCIKKIGEDIILVEISEHGLHGSKDKKRKDKHVYNYGDYGEQYKSYYGSDHDDKKDKHKHDDCRPPHHDDCRPPHHDDCRPPHHDDCRPPHHNDCRPPHHDDCRPPHHEQPNCDRRCEKCMLFDCMHRWRNGGGIFVDNKKYD